MTRLEWGGKNRPHPASIAALFFKPRINYRSDNRVSSHAPPKTSILGFSDLQKFEREKFFHQSPTIYAEGSRTSFQDH